MTRRTIVYAIAALSLLASFFPDAHAQGTRATPCSPTTPNDAICLEADAPTTYVSGAAIPSSVTLTYRLERRAGTTGNFSTVITSQTAPRFYLTGLTPGTYYFRAYANCSGCTESVASNTVNADATAPPPPQPNPPGLRVVKVTISSDRAPVYEVLPDEGEFDFDRGRRVGSVRVGNTCDPERTTGDGFYALKRPSSATLTRSRSAKALPTALVARCA